MTISLYDPLDYDNLMRGVVYHFEKRQKWSLDFEITAKFFSPTVSSGIDVSRIAAAKIQGPGVYALYYTGNMTCYSSIGANVPIYVGKAVPRGARTGGKLNSDGPALRRRIVEHSKSIDQALNLHIFDFSFRYLPVVPVWIILAERFLIEHYKPVWNMCLEGFGDHDPGSGRSGSKRSWWDTLHPGRPWTDRLANARTDEEAIDKVNRFFDKISKSRTKDVRN